MDLDTVKAITPFITLGVTLFVGLIGWGMRLLIRDTAHQLETLRHEVHRRLVRIERSLDQLEAARLADHKEVYDRFVSKEWFFRTLSRTELTLRRLAERVQKLVDRLPASRPRKTG